MVDWFNFLLECGMYRNGCHKWSVEQLINHREVAVGNTFGATALSSYGGFWIRWVLGLPSRRISLTHRISFAIIESAGAQDYGIITAYTPAASKADAIMLQNAVGFYLMGWFIFTTLMVLCTLKSTLAFFMLFFTLDVAFLML